MPNHCQTDLHVVLPNIVIMNMDNGYNKPSVIVNHMKMALQFAVLQFKILLLNGYITNYWT